MIAMLPRAATGVLTRAIPVAAASSAVVRSRAVDPRGTVSSATACPRPVTGGKLRHPVIHFRTPRRMRVLTLQRFTGIVYDVMSAQ